MVIPLMTTRTLLVALLLPITLACRPAAAEGQAPQTDSMQEQDTSKLSVATLGMGCFWCTEAVFNDLKGIARVEVGFSGGKVKHPAYREVTTGRTGHVEVGRIWFDPEVISYADILTVFFHVHDPTTLNRQGADVGTHYRSVIFYHDEAQRETAERVLSETAASSLWKDPIVTAIEPITNYYKAEDYHQEYFANNPNQGYCSYVIAPKVAKVRKEFRHLLKEE